MNDADIRRKQGIVTAVLARFGEVRPERKVRPFLALCSGSAPENCRGWCGYGDTRPMCHHEEPISQIQEEEPKRPVCDVSDLPTAFQEIEKLPRVKELFIGEYLHFMVESSFAGYLHLFNFGTDGDVARLYPLPGCDSQYIKVCNRKYVKASNAELRRDSEPSPPTTCSQAWCECQDPRTVWNGTRKQWICADCKKPVNRGERALYKELGPVNEYPERVVAIITREDISLKPSDLYPGWDIYDAVSPVLVESGSRSVRGGDAGADDDDFGRPDRSADWFWELPSQDWQWGLIEVPVKERQGD